MWLVPACMCVWGNHYLLQTQEHEPSAARNRARWPADGWPVCCDIEDKVLRFVLVCVCVCGWTNSVRNKPWVQSSPWVLSPRPPVQLPLNESLHPLEETNYSCQLVLVNSVPRLPLTYPSVSFWISSDKVNTAPLNRVRMLMNGASGLRRFITITSVYSNGVLGNRMLVANDTHR